MKKTIAFLINPISGMGGKVGLKGTDGPDILARALELNACPEAGLKAAKAIEKMANLSDEHIFLTASGEMGEVVLRSAGISCEIIHRADGRTTVQDTVCFLKKVLDRGGVDLLVFVGGDGTARDVSTIIDEEMPVVGIPAGVKIHSAC